jgi:hypothetical protein
MKQRIENILNKVGERMEEYLAKKDFGSTTNLSPLLARAQQLQRHYADLERDVCEIEETLAGMDGKSDGQRASHLIPPPRRASNSAQTNRAPPKTLRIQINWKANGRNHDKEEICFRTAADGMVVFLGRLVEEFGNDALQKMLRIPANRGPLLSKSPFSDFLNQTTGNPYSHKRLRGTEYYVLTHSETPEKVEILTRVCQVLRLTPGSIDIRAVERPSLLDLYD